MPADRYKDQHIQEAVLVFCSVVIGVFVCIPIVILGMGVGSPGERLTVVVLFIVAFGLGSAWWLEDPALAIAAMLGFSASLVNVKIGRAHV